MKISKFFVKIAAYFSSKREKTSHEDFEIEIFLLREQKKIDAKTLVGLV